MGAFFVSYTLPMQAPQSDYRTRIIQHGTASLTDAELLDVLLSAEPTDATLAGLRRLVQWSGSLQGLARRTLAELAHREGISERKALQLLAAFELGRRATRADSRQLKFGNAKEVAAYVQPLLRDATQEQLLVLLLDRAGQLLAERIVFVGGVTSTVVDPKVIFQVVLAEKAAAFLVCHNHPSGNLSPSDHDIAITERLKGGAQLLDLQLLDHLIVSYKGYFSFQEQGLL